MYDTTTLILACIGSFMAGFMICLTFKMLFLTPWLRAFFSGGRIGVMNIVGMRLRGSPVHLLLDAHLALIQSGEQSRMQIVEATYIANKSKIQTSDDLTELAREQFRREPEHHKRKK